MRIWIADEEENLRTIASKNDVQPENLIPLNPHIAHLDLNISGIPVYLPSSLATLTNPSNVLAPCLPPLPQSTYYLRFQLNQSEQAECNKGDPDLIVYGVVTRAVVLIEPNKKT